MAIKISPDAQRLAYLNIKILMTKCFMSAQQIPKQLLVLTNEIKNFTISIF